MTTLFRPTRRTAIRTFAGGAGALLALRALAAPPYEEDVTHEGGGDDGTAPPQGSPLPQSKSAYGIVSVALSGIALGAAATMGALVAAAEPTPFGEMAFYGIMGGTSTYLANYYAYLAYDPPQADYQRIAVPANLDLTGLPEALDLSDADRILLQRAVDHGEHLRAYLDTIERRQTAVALEDGEWTGLHDHQLAALAAALAAQAPLVAILFDRALADFERAIAGRRAVAFDPNALPAQADTLRAAFLHWAGFEPREVAAADWVSYLEGASLGTFADDLAALRPEVDDAAIRWTDPGEWIALT